MHAKHNGFILTITLAIMIVLAACQPAGPAPTSTPGAALSAVLKEVQGQAQVKQPGASAFSPASVGMSLQQNGQVQTGADGHVRIDLSTGTIIRVSPSSLFTLVSSQSAGSGASTQFKLDLGRIFVILNGGSVDVNTPSGVASVRGSYLSVTIDPATGDVTVTCLEGHCGADNPAGGVDLTDGQQTVLFHCDLTSGQCTVPSVGPMTPDEFQQWLDNNPEAQQVLNDVYATLTAMAPTPVPSATPVPTATLIPLGCLTITGPKTGSPTDPVGPITFSWDAKDGASKYRLTIHYPNGALASFDTSDTSITRYAESMPDGGTYSWDVTALDGSGAPICHTDSFSFDKPKTEIPEPKPPACTMAKAQFGDPNAPCYCDGSSNMPPYCPAG